MSTSFLFYGKLFVANIYYGYKVASNVLLQLFLHFDDGIFPVGSVIQGTELSGFASNLLLSLTLFLPAMDGISPYMSVT